MNYNLTLHKQRQVIFIRYRIVLISGVRWFERDLRSVPRRRVRETTDLRRSLRPEDFDKTLSELYIV